MDHLGNRDSDSKAGAGFLFDHLSAGGLGAGEGVLPKLGGVAGIFFQRQAADAGARPDRHHAVAVLAEDDRGDLGGGGLEIEGQQTAEPQRVEQRAEADHPALRQAKLLFGQISEDVDRVTHHQHSGVGFVAG